MLRPLVLAIAGSLASGVLGAECAPPPDPARAQYIVGYGSLMQDDSRKRASPKAGPAHPVEIEGYRRGWFVRGRAVGFGATYLGVLPDGDGRINAVIYRVDAAELAATDRREASYCRTALPVADIRPLERGYLPPQAAQAWIYVSRPRSIAPPDWRNPIVQSYVDVFVSGCLEQGERARLADFSRQCLATTAGWSEYWVNDRVYPRRPFVYQPRSGEIDDLLSRQLPRFFPRIRIESGG